MPTTDRKSTVPSISSSAPPARYTGVTVRRSGGLACRQRCTRRAITTPENATPTPRQPVQPAHREVGVGGDREHVLRAAGAAVDVAGGQHQREEPDGGDHVTEPDQPAVEGRLQTSGGEREHKMDRRGDEQVLQQAPIENSSGGSVRSRMLMYQANAVSTISPPTGLSGRRYHANSPTPANPNPITRSRAIHSSRSSVKSADAISGTSARPTRAAARPFAHRTPRRGFMGRACAAPRRSAATSG